MRLKGARNKMKRWLEGFTPEPEQTNLYHITDNLICIEVSEVVDVLDEVKRFLQICCFQKPVSQILQVGKNVIENVLEIRRPY